MQDTICAIATAQGGAIGIVRVSGPRAIEIADTIFTPHHNWKKLSECKPYTLAFGTIVDNGEVVDEVLVSVFRAPHSYTGEDAVEISCHGSSYILQKVMQLLVDGGCRTAGPGEYTQRAFLNGKMDLSQAEAVADLIASTSAASHRMAMNQMRGAFSRELAVLRERLLHLTSLMELELDFSDHEELEFADRHELTSVATEIDNVISSLIASFRQGNAIKNGIPVAIVGETNAGKSTLLNRLVGEERAIVSDIHGTTRDVIEDVVSIGGTLFRFIDTAGLRDTADTIESIGIERTLAKTRQAEIVLLVLDSTCAASQYADLAPKVLPLCKDKTLIVVLNKADLTKDEAPLQLTLPGCEGEQAPLQLPPSGGEREVTNATHEANNVSHEANNATHKTDTTALPRMGELEGASAFVSLSAKDGNGIDRLQAMLTACMPQADNANGVIVSNMRHMEALRAAHDDIARVLDGLQSGLPSDLISQDLRDCIRHLGEITGGEIQTDEVLGNIFKHFCVGK